ncbi:MAG TPA: hypothetical protein VIL85_02195 [Thermomicrobiales bacterium]
MALELLPLLKVQRAVLDTPPGPGRFQRYLAAMLDKDGDMALPLAAFNPMSKPHVTALLDSLLAMGAEGEAQSALAEAARRLGPDTPQLRVGLVVVDDARGGWTNRFLTDADHRFGGATYAKRGFATGYLWTGDETTRAMIRAEILATIYRHCYKARNGLPQTLREMLTLEGLTFTFSGVTTPLDEGAALRTRSIITPLLDEAAQPTVIACLYGDEAAISVGYPPLGVPAWGGFALAAIAARAQRWDPLKALRGVATLRFR